MQTEIVKLEQVQVNNANPRYIQDSKFDNLVKSLLILPKMMQLRPIVVDSTFVALGGNMRLRALKFISGLSVEDVYSKLQTLGEFEKKTKAEKEALVSHWALWLDKPTAHIIRANELSEAEQREFIIKDNVGYGEWDNDMLANEWSEDELREWGLDVVDTSDGSDENGQKEDTSKLGSLQERFIVPPFSILDTRKGYWQARKKLWRERIGDNGESRENTLAAGETNCMASINSGVSLLDPVMAELVCKWFGIEGGKSFDCFAGDSVFGYVASYLGHEFTGIELREEQAALNNERVAGMNARYICDDGQNVARHIEAKSQDLLFSCPPYFDLEVYSDKPNDASNQGTYEEFIAILENAFSNAIKCLRDNRFAAIVVGDVRDKKTGFYYDFIGDIKRIFKANGMPLYNELIIVEPIGTLPQRVQRYMLNRKIGKCHQNIMIFYKGDTKEISNNYKKIEYASEDVAAFGVDFGDEAGGDTGEI